MASDADAPVVLLGTAEDEPLTGRIAAELRALGIAIEIRVVSGEETGIDLEVESALRDGARAAVRIDAQNGRTEVSIADPGSRRVVLRQVLQGPPTAALAPVLAVRTVEFVRATLLGPREEGRRRGASDRNPDAATDLRAGGKPDSDFDKAISQMSGLGLTLDSGMVFKSGGLAAEVAVGIIARLRLFPRIGVELMGFSPITSEQVTVVQDSAGGATRASTWLAGAGLFARQPLGRRAGLELGSGVLAAFVQISDVAPASNSMPQATKSPHGFSIYGRLGADYALSRNLALRLDLMGGAATQPAGIDNKTPNPTAIRQLWGGAFAAALGGVEARWF